MLTSLEKRLNLGVKACFNGMKFDHSPDLKLNYNILPVQFFLDIKAFNYYWEFKDLMNPGFKRKIVIPIVKKASKVEIKNLRSENQFRVCTQSFFQESSFNVEHPIWKNQ